MAAPEGQARISAERRFLRRGPLAARVTKWRAPRNDLEVPGVSPYGTSGLGLPNIENGLNGPWSSRRRPERPSAQGATGRDFSFGKGNESTTGGCCIHVVGDGQEDVYVRLALCRHIEPVRRTCHCCTPRKTVASGALALLIAIPSCIWATVLTFRATQEVVAKYGIEGKARSSITAAVLNSPDRFDNWLNLKTG